MPTAIPYGARVVIRATLERRVELETVPVGPGPRTYQKTAKVWRRVEVPAERPLVGIFLGPRTLRNGYRGWEEEVGATFEQVGPTLAGALVSTGPHRKPIPVLLEDLELEAPRELATLLSSEIGDAIAAHDAGEAVNPTERALAVLLGFALGPTAEFLPGYRIVSRLGWPVGAYAPSTLEDARLVAEHLDEKYPSDAPHRIERLATVSVPR